CRLWLPRTEDAMHVLDQRGAREAYGRGFFERPLAGPAIVHDAVDRPDGTDAICGGAVDVDRRQIRLDDDLQEPLGYRWVWCLAVEGKVHVTQAGGLDGLGLFGDAWF